MDDYFGWPFLGTWILTFLGVWAGCIAEYGFLLGVGLGWLPASIVATVIALLWPLVWLVVCGIVLWLLIVLKQGA